jgi:predicted O-methyltransferase YrrM
VLFEGGIDLLFIDSAHDFEHVNAEYEAWVKYVVPGGIIAFDDSTFPGVRAVIERALSDGWEVHRIADSITALKRRQEA